MTPNRMMTLNCTYTIDPIYLNFYNGIDKNIFVVNFMTGKHQIGPGFENIVSESEKETKKDYYIIILKL